MKLLFIGFMEIIIVIGIFCLIIAFIIKIIDKLLH